MVNKTLYDYPNFITLLPELNALLTRIAKVASVLHQQGWAEANAGNVSVRVTNLIKPRLGEQETDPNDSSLFLVSRSGSRYRDIAENPADGLMLIVIGQEEQRFPQDAIPTSEWGCHRRIHDTDLHENYPCILHAHPTEVIALSLSKAYTDSSTLSAYLASLLPELPLYLSEGIVATNYALPGSNDLASISAKSFMDKKALIWQGHGLVCRGKNPDEALDYMEIINKAARLHFLADK